MSFLPALTWLRGQKEYPQFFWSDRRETIAASGATELFSALPLREELVVGGTCFSPPGPLWKPFPPSLFFTPNRLFQDGIVGTSSGREKILSKFHFPLEPQWEELLLRSLSEIERGSFSKVVLARRTELFLDAPPSPWSLLKRLSEEVPQGTLFGIALDEESSFFGITPETLFSRNGIKFTTEAVAGTRKVGDEEALLGSEKDNREFASVVDFLSKTLSSFCSSHTVGEKKIRRAGPLVHLCRELQGILKEGVSDQELLLACHPTPAVGGSPRKEALTFLREHEKIDRGWYAGAVGFSKKERAQFSVAIRSALLQKNRLHLFAGTGIVPGSKAKEEWGELDHKISSYQKLFR